MTSSPSHWFDTPLGQYLLAREQEIFDAEVADAFGYQALQFGLPQLDCLRANRIAGRRVLAQQGEADILGDVCELPIATASIDLVVLPHTLEFSASPHQVLREVQRVLMPEGHLVLSGFNPWSLWGAARWLPGGRDAFPWNGQFIGLPRIKDWMALLGFEVASGRMAAYVPPCRGEQWLSRCAFMERAGDRWWPIAGGVYFLHCVKRVKGMRLITPRWRMASARRRMLAAVPQKLAHLQAARRSEQGSRPGRGRP